MQVMTYTNSKLYGETELSELIYEKMCYFCSAWKSFDLTESKNFGYCKRYDMKTQAYEWCETCDRGLAPKKLDEFLL
jgi:hypothetical protein